ncbi:M4 family metallopeptidase [Alkalicoccus saliphilus]|uniref:Neutral metalloproteinase n=1 Tax=Alkalicoccus saliphilus TaxID=200989 RepID=A0A2T4U655_9BACI|nr:M4 family metallopeptidase [Alkalicoccus saliphilus]PTL38845.1 peptidase M4 family protein [Alkalicoccus saliphilus]
MKFKKSLVLASASMMFASSFATASAAEGETVEQMGDDSRIQLVNEESDEVELFQVQSDEEKAAAFLEAHDAVDIPENLELVSEETDDLGMSHLRFQQVVNGISVHGQDLIVHFSEEKEITSANGRYLQELDGQKLETSADVTEEQAFQTVLAAVEAPAELEDSSVELIYYPLDNDIHLAYKVNVNYMGEDPKDYYAFVDAQSGEILDKYNTLHSLEEYVEGTKEAEAVKEASSGEEKTDASAADNSVSIQVSPEELDSSNYKRSSGAGVGVLGENRNMEISHRAGDDRGRTFELLDFTRPDLTGIFTYDAQHQGSLPGVPYANENASFKDERSGAGVDAHYNSTIVYDYFLEEHGRNSIDDNGFEIVSSVHYGENFNNAFWNGSQMTYGDGDGEFFIPLSAGLDVAAHEITHGVTTNTANLVYRFQPGAVNEAMSDIFGVLVDTESWDIGDNVMAPAMKEEGRTALRSLEEPGKFQVNEDYWEYGNGDGRYPSHMDEYYDLPRNLDNGGVHTNSSIINHAAYLIGTETSRDVLGQVTYRALTVYLTSQSDFSDTRYAFIQSAVDIYGEDSEEVSAVEAGFDGVGIYE